MSPQKCMHKTNFIPQILLFVLTITLFPAQLFAAEIDLGRPQTARSAGVSTTLDVIAIEPSTGSATTIEASGTWSNGCVPEFNSVELTSFWGGGTVQIMATADPASIPCGQTETEWGFPIDVQFERPGEYSIELLITSEQLGTTEVYARHDVWVEGHLAFTPQAPAPDEDVALTVTGIHGDGCIPEYASHEIIDDKIVVELMTPDSAVWVCGQVLTSWSIGLGIGALESGSYVVEIYQSDQYEGEPLNRLLYKTETLSVGVRRSGQFTDYLIYLPGIVLE